MDLIRMRDREGRRFSWPLLLLMVSIGTMAIIAAQVHNQAKSHRITAERLLRDYAAFAAWSFGGHANEEVGGVTWAALSPVMHAGPHTSPSIPTVADLPEYYADNIRVCEPCMDNPPAAYFAFTLGADSIAMLGKETAAQDGAWLRDTVTAHVRSVAAEAGWRSAVLWGPARKTLLAYATMPAIWGDTIIYGLVFDDARYNTMFGSRFDDYLILPAALTEGRRNSEILAARVSAPDGTELFRSGDWPDWPFHAEEHTPVRTGGLIVSVAVKPEMADALIIGGLPRSRLPFLLGLLALAGALTVVAVVQMRREAQMARMRSDFVASVSHELRTPLAQIRLFLETLRLGRFRTEEQREWSLENIDRETTRLAHLVENVLRFARPERRGPGPAPEAMDATAEVREAVRFFEPLAASRRATITADLPDAAPALIPRESLRQLLLNLLDNAVKYGPAGQTVTVSLETRPETVVLRVDDQGPGIPAGERDAVWTPFFRGAGATARAAGGSGIGLSVVRDIVERHGGRIRVEASPSGGARFTVELPGGETQRTPAPTAAAGPGASAAAATGTTGGA